MQATRRRAVGLAHHCHAAGPAGDRRARRSSTRRARPSRRRRCRPTRRPPATTQLACGRWARPHPRGRSAARCWWRSATRRSAPAKRARRSNLHRGREIARRVAATDAAGARRHRLRHAHVAHRRRWLVAVDADQGSAGRHSPARQPRARAAAEPRCAARWSVLDPASSGGRASTARRWRWRAGSATRQPVRRVERHRAGALVARSCSAADAAGAGGDAAGAARRPPGVGGRPPHRLARRRPDGGRRQRRRHAHRAFCIRRTAIHRQPFAHGAANCRAMLALHAGRFADAEDLAMQALQLAARFEPGHRRGGGAAVHRCGANRAGWPSSHRC